MSNRLRILGAVLLVLAVSTSCSHDVTRPGSEGPSLIRPSGVVSGEALGNQPTQTPPGKPGQSGAIASVRVHAKTGGVLNAGRYMLVIPPNALTTDTTISVKSLDCFGLVMCELEPHGLVFQKPVRLQVDLRGTFARPGDSLTIYWFDDQGHWQDMGGTFDVSRMVIWTDLPHFSKYTAGRSGW